MYVVYGLEDPRDHLYHYIGITNNVYRRFNQHVTGSSGNIEKNSWIFECRQSGIMIVMREIERLSSDEEAAQREKLWIAHYLHLGHPLHNSAIARSLSGKPTMPEMDKHSHEKPHVKPDAKQVPTLSKGASIVDRGVRQLKAERDSSFFHMFPLTFGMLAAFLFTTGAAILFLLAWEALELTWLAIAGSITGYCAVILAVLYYLYMHSLDLEGKSRMSEGKES